MCQGGFQSNCKMLLALRGHWVFPLHPAPRAMCCGEAGGFPLTQPSSVAASELKEEAASHNLKHQPQTYPHSLPYAPEG